MLREIWCFIFGHDFKRWVTVEETSFYTSRGYWEKRDFCPTCGKNLRSNL